MPKRDSDLLIQDMLEAVRKIEPYPEGSRQLAAISLQPGFPDSEGWAAFGLRARR